MFHFVIILSLIPTIIHHKIQSGFLHSILFSNLKKIFSLFLILFSILFLYSSTRFCLDIKRFCFEIKIFY